MKKSKHILWAAGMLLTVFNACKTEDRGMEPTGSSSRNINIGDAARSGTNWTLTFSDDFNGTTLDASKWSYGFGWGPNSDAFAEKTRPENITISNGTLKMKLECVGTDIWSGAINTKNKLVQRQGYWEARMKLPKARTGLNPAFWTKFNSEVWPVEIDIIEVFGANQSAQFSVHFGGAWPNNRASGAAYDGGDLSTDFHLYGMEWSETDVKWYLDGQLRRTLSLSNPGARDWFMSQANADAEGMYMMVNLHAMKNEAYECSSPSIMEVDYVKVYQSSPAPTPPAGPLKNKGFETGHLHPWTSWGNNSITESNKRSGYFAVDAWWGSRVEQLVTGLQPNTTYHVKGWGKVASAGLSGRIGVKDFGGTEVSSPAFTSTSFTQSTVTFTTGSTNTSALIVLYAPTDGLITFDDIEWGVSTTTSTNKAVNPGFETGSLSPWSGWNNAISTSRKQSGTYGLDVWWNGNAEQTITGLSSNTTYTVRAWGKNTESGVTGRILAKNFGGTEVSTAFTSNSEFVQKSFTFTTGSSNTSVVIGLYAPSNGMTTFDNIEVVQ